VPRRRRAGRGVRAGGVAGRGARVLAEHTDGRYLQFIFQDQRLAGALVLGAGGPDAALTKALETGADLAPLLARAPTAAAFAAALAGRPGPV